MIVRLVVGLSVCFPVVVILAMSILGRQAVRRGLDMDSRVDSDLKNLVGLLRYGQAAGLVTRWIRMGGGHAELTICAFD